MKRYPASTLLGLIGLFAFGCSTPDDEFGSDNGPAIVLPGGGLTPGGNGTPGVTNVPAATIEEMRKSSCAGWSAEPEAVPSVLQLVVDVSSSMNDRAPGSNQNKWEVTRDALLEAIPGVTSSGLPASMAVGLLFYPNIPNAAINARPGNLTGCVRTDAMVNMDLLGPAGATHRERLRTSFLDVRLNRSTPTHDAFRHALNQGLLPARFGGSKYMLLITDGTPTLSLGCVNPAGRLEGVDPRPIVEEIRLAAEQGVSTFLIGSPGSEGNRTWMSEAARIGGTATPGCADRGPNYCHMDLTASPDFSKALREGLADVTGQVAACTYELPDPPVGEALDDSLVNVILTPSDGKPAQLIGRNTSSTCTEGWQIQGDEVKICPKTCDAIQKDTGSSLELLFGCLALDVPH